MKFTKGNKILQTSKQKTFLTRVKQQLCFFKACPRIIRETVNSGGFRVRGPAPHSTLPFASSASLIFKTEKSSQDLSLAQATQSGKVEASLVKVRDRLSLKHTLNVLASTILFLKSPILPELKSRLPTAKELWPANNNYAE